MGAGPQALVLKTGAVTPNLPHSSVSSALPGPAPPHSGS